MPIILNLCPTDVKVCITRGDSVVMTFQMQDDATPPVDIDITGRSYIMTVDSLENPPDGTTEEFNMTGALGAGPPTALVSFTPTVSQTNLSIGDHYFDIQETNGAALRTVAKGVFEVKQDITK